MRDWQFLQVNATTRQVIEKFNVNANSSRFMDYVTGTIMNNGLLFTDTETVEGEPITPLSKVNLSGIVNSNTIFDNFRMYFRESNSIVELDQFPVDLTMYNDNKPHFLYFKEDRTYRVSDYIFGQSDEVMICRFIINLDRTWQQMYITAQRAGTPSYNSGEEFYEIDGINVKSPGGLELSHTDGLVKRSGIEFTDKFSPDLYRDFSSPDVRVPIRYTNLSNEVDYTLNSTYNIDPNHYMTYDFNSKLKNSASERIRNIFNNIYGIDVYAKEASEALHNAIAITSEQSEYRRILNVFLAHMNNIYVLIGELADFLGDDYFRLIDLTLLNENIQAYMDYSTEYFDISVQITEDTVQRVADAAYFLVSGKSDVCSHPAEEILIDIYDAVNSLTITAGELKNVPTNKFTIQRVLWDIYEGCFIVQYGDTVYDTLEDAIAQVGSMLYPVPFGRLMYIPLSVIVLRQGTVDLKTDLESVILIKQYIYADSEQEGFADYYARALANRGLTYIAQILNGTLPVGKADSLKHTDLATGATIEYHDGDFFLNYDNLRNSVQVINSLDRSTYNSKEALSAYQGYLLNRDKLNRDGSNSITGVLKPDGNGNRDLGTSANRFGTVYSSGMNTNGNIIPAVNSNGQTGYSLGSSSAYWKTIYAKAIEGLSSLSATNITATSSLTVNGDSALGGFVTFSNPPRFSDSRRFVLSRGDNGAGASVDFLEAAAGKNSGNLGNYSNKSIIVSW